jgi:DNA-binding FadR family transcriptional regulator
MAILSPPRISPYRLSDEVARRLLERIRDGRLTPGARLPPERRLAKTLGVSLPTIREALRTLEAMGVVAIQHGRGSFVHPGGSLGGVWSSRWMRWTLQNASSLIELLEVQETIESKSAWLAALNATQRDHRRLEKLLRDSQQFVEAQAAGNGDAEVLASYVTLDYAIHHALADAARNRFLRSLVEGLGTTLQGAREATLAIPGRLQRSFEEHSRIIDAVRRGDAEASRTAMEAHVRQVLEEVRSVKGRPRARTRQR